MSDITDKHMHGDGEAATKIDGVIPAIHDEFTATSAETDAFDEHATTFHRFGDDGDDDDNATQFRRADTRGRSDDETESPKAETPAFDEHATTFNRNIGRTDDDRSDVETTFNRAVDPAIDASAPTKFKAGGTPSSTERLAPGDRIFNGTYVVTREINTSGREADAYIGHFADEPANQVFIKHFRQYRSNAQYRSKKAELERRMLSIDHPNCVKMLDTEISETRIIEVYPLLAGEPLSAALARNPEPPREYIMSVLRQVAAGIAHLHEKIGLAHRDIKPDNIWVVPGETPQFVIIDYGTVCATDTGGATVVEFTLKYAPPEALRPSLGRDEDLMAFDWWSLGRTIQEMADGRHVYTRIAGQFKLETGDQKQIGSIFSAILLEQERDRYPVRAGLVEWSAPQWQPVLRGLLTSKRQLRWGYPQVAAWLAGEKPADSYDVAADVEVYRYKNREYDYASAASVLAQAENWPDAVQNVIERSGLIQYARKLMNLRLNADLDEINAAYPAIAAHGPDTAADLITALALARLGQDKQMPLTIRGEIVSAAMLTNAVKNKNVAFIHGCMTPQFRIQLEKIDPVRFAELTPLLVNFSKVAELLDRWGVPNLASRERMLKAYILVSAPRETLIDAIEKSKKDLSRSKHIELNGYFQRPASGTLPQLAALVFILNDDPQRHEFVTHAFDELDEAAQLRTDIPIYRTAYARAWLLQLSRFTDLLNIPRKFAIVVFLILGGSLEVAKYDPKISDLGTHVYQALGNALVIGITLFVLRLVMRFAVRQFTAGPAAFGKVGNMSAGASHSYLQANRQSTGVPTSLIDTYRQLAQLNRRARELRPRHPDLRPAYPPVPVVSVFLAACIIGVFGCIPAAFVRVQHETAAAQKLSTEYMVMRSLHAFVDPHDNSAARFTTGAANAFLTNQPRRDNYARSFREFGKFESDRQLSPGGQSPLRSMWVIMYQRCAFRVDVTREGEMLTEMAIPIWRARPGHPNGCAGRV